MGTYSWYLTSRNNAASTEIKWGPNVFTNPVLRESYGTVKTLEEVGKAFHEHKLFGYLSDDLVQELRTLSFLLVPNNYFPRLYYSWEGNKDVYCIEFVPGSYNVTFFILKDVQDANETVPEHSGWHLY